MGLNQQALLWRGGLPWGFRRVQQRPRRRAYGAWNSLVGGHSCICVHILAIYMHIWHIHAYTCIDLGRAYIHAYMCIYYVTDRVSLQGEHDICIHVHIHAYTCIYCVCSYIIIYIDYDAIFVHILAYTCIYCQQQLYWILNFLHVYAYVYARICTYIVTYMQVNARLCNYMEINTPNNFPYNKYVHIRAIRAYTCNIRLNIRAYTYFQNPIIRAYKSHSIC